MGRSEGGCLASEVPKNYSVVCVNSGFHCDENAICTLLGCYADYKGNYVPTFRDNLLGAISRGSRIPIFLGLL